MGKNNEILNKPSRDLPLLRSRTEVNYKASVYTLQLRLCFVTEHTGTSVNCNIIVTEGV